MNAFWLSGVVYGTFPFALLREREMQEDKLAAQPAGDSTTILTACLPAWLTSRSLFGASHFLKWCANVERKVILLLLCLLLSLASFFNLFLILLLQFYYYYFYLFACYFVGKYQLQSQSRSRSGRCRRRRRQRRISLLQFCNSRSASPYIHK